MATLLISGNVFIVFVEKVGGMRVSRPHHSSASEKEEPKKSEDKSDEVPRLVL